MAAAIAREASGGCIHPITMPGRLPSPVRESYSRYRVEGFSTWRVRQSSSEAVRTAIGKRNGALSQAHAADLSRQVLRALAARTGIDPAVVDDVIWGCVGQVGDQSSNIGRYAVLAAGWPESVPGTTINRACGSSQQAVEFAFAGVISGAYDLVVAGGVEVMSRVPLGATRQGGFPVRAARVMARYDNFEFNQGEGAELIAERWGLDRQRLDEYAVPVARARRRRDRLRRLRQRRSSR